MPTRKRGRRKRNFGNYIKGNVNEELPLGTLASKTLVRAIFDNAVTEVTRISSLVASWAMQEFTVASGDGPILVGIAHSDYSAAEIEEFIEQTAGWQAFDLVQKEISSRLIRTIGTFRASGPGGSSFDPTVLNDGLPIKTKLNWKLGTGQSLALWAYNLDTSALATTVPIVFVDGHANLWIQ